MILIYYKKLTCFTLAEHHFIWQYGMPRDKEANICKNMCVQGKTQLKFIQTCFFCFYKQFVKVAKIWK